VSMGISIPNEKISEFSRRWKISELALFGSNLFFAHESKRISNMVQMTAMNTEDSVVKCVVMAFDMIKLKTQHAWLDYDQGANVEDHEQLVRY
jgi:hypothetical protein